jgi:hypothetical protein
VLTKERITSPLPKAEDIKNEALLRPKRIEEFIGQTEI